MQPVFYLDVSKVRPGRLDELKSAMEHLSSYVESHVPRLLSYGFHLDRDEETMTVVAVHPDSDSMAFHLDTCKAEFRKFADLIELSAIEVYGHVDASVIERLKTKARMLGQENVSVHEFRAGFSRLSGDRI